MPAGGPSPKGALRQVHLWVKEGVTISPPFDLLPQLWQGAKVTFQLTLVSAFFAFIFSFVAGFGRMSSNAPVRWLSGFVVEVVRGTSLLVQLFWLFYALPLFGLRLPAFTAGVIALALNYGAYGSEIVRGAVQSIPKGQTEAGIALNMTPWQRLRRVILPQAFLVMLPGFGNLVIELLKGTALVSLITISDLTFRGQMLNTTTARTIEIYSLLLIMYFLMAYPLTLAVRWFERRMSVWRPSR